ncbi:glycosyltransferase [Phaeovulum sp. NW3]|uniref:glycosyltransferase n=1 Tax=Phaeovulum sp. NW3 TaxID=2934933 RepID=UPI0020205AA4|nr:glycosyltransferase [Phaeovulum sp. NW3]
MPRLLSLNSYHYRRGGSDVVYFDHADLFAQNGWDTSFFAMHHPRNLHTPDAAHFADLVDFEFPGRGIARLRTAWRTIYNGQARGQLRALLARQRFDVAHVHCIYHHLTPAVFADLAAARVPVVLTAHDLKLACPAYKMMNAGGLCERCKSGSLVNVVRQRCIKGSAAASAIVAAEAWLHRLLGSYDHVAHVVAPSRFYRDKLIDWGFPADRISHIPNFTRPLAPRHAGAHDGNILYFGRLSEEKGLFTLIKAAARAGVPVDIAGSGPIEGALRAAAAQTGAPIRFLGRLGGAALWARVGRARAVVLPSEWYENAPMSVLEAYQLHRPVIGAAIGGIPELVTPPGAVPCGWLFAPGDADALAACLQQVAGAPDSDLRARGAAGHALAIGDFAPARYFAAMRALYARLGVNVEKVSE